MKMIYIGMGRERALAFADEIRAAFAQPHGTATVTVEAESNDGSGGVTIELSNDDMERAEVGNTVYVDIEKG